MKPRALILKVAGTNCDYETCYAFEMAGAEWDLVHINQLISGEKNITDYQLIAFPGGFSYGDDISAAKVLVTKIKARLLDGFKNAIAGGVPVIGICNGFQVLIKLGLLPGEEIGIATLFYNDSYKFEDRWVMLLPTEADCIWTKNLSSPLIYPVAHLEGKFIVEKKSLEKIEASKRVVFRYAEEKGLSAAGGKFPYNPNGSMNDIAGLTDETGLILGMMPHPERHLFPTNHPHWPRAGLEPAGDGLCLFRNAIKFVQQA